MKIFGKNISTKVEDIPENESIIDDEDENVIDIQKEEKKKKIRKRVMLGTIAMAAAGAVVGLAIKGSNYDLIDKSEEIDVPTLEDKSEEDDTDDAKAEEKKSTE